MFGIAGHGAFCASFLLFLDLSGMNGLVPCATARVAGLCAGKAAAAEAFPILGWPSVRG